MSRSKAADGTQFARLLTRLSQAFALLLAATPALAQDTAENVPSEPLPLFKAVCMGSGARLTRKIAAEANFSVLPDPARRALGKVVPKTPEDALKAPIADAAAVPNRMYQISSGLLYLLVPSATPAPGAPLADSCMVLWQSSGDDDYLQARKLVLPNEDSVPMYQRPNSKPNGFIFATSAEGQSRITLATYGGWIALRTSTDAPPADAQQGN